MCVLLLVIAGERASEILFLDAITFELKRFFICCIGVKYGNNKSLDGLAEVGCLRCFVVCGAGADGVW